MRFLNFAQRTLFVIFWTLIIFGFEAPYAAVLTLISALTHELGHITAIAVISKGRPRVPHGSLNGLRISVYPSSYKEEMIVAASGPLFNIALFLLLSALEKGACGASAAYLSDFAILNLMTGLSNLFPLEEYDGYRIIRAFLLLIFKDFTRPIRILEEISFIISAVSAFFILYLMLKIGEGYWFFAVLLTLILSFIAKRQSQTF